MNNKSFMPPDIDSNPVPIRVCVSPQACVKRDQNGLNMYHYISPHRMNTMSCASLQCTLCNVLKATMQPPQWPVEVRRLHCNICMYGF